MEGGDLNVQTFGFLFLRKGGAIGGLCHLGSVAGADWSYSLSHASDSELDKKEITAPWPKERLFQ